MEKSQLIKCHCVIDIIFKINIGQGANSKSKTLYFIYVALLILQQLQEMLKMVQFRSVALSCLTICDPIDCSISGLPVHYQLLELTQIHVHWVGDAIQPPHPLWSPSPPAFNLSQHPGLFQWVRSSNQVAKVLKFQLQHQSFQWIFRSDFL